MIIIVIMMQVSVVDNIIIIANVFAYIPATTGVVVIINIPDLYTIATIYYY